MNKVGIVVVGFFEMVVVFYKIVVDLIPVYTIMLFDV